MGPGPSTSIIPKDPWDQGQGPMGPGSMTSENAIGYIYIYVVLFVRNALTLQCKVKPGSGPATKKRKVKSEGGGGPVRAEPAEPARKALTDKNKEQLTKMHAALGAARKKIEETLHPVTLNPTWKKLYQNTS